MILALQTGGAGMAMLIQFALLIGIMYFLLIMPQRREAKRHREMLAALQRGDEVVTMGGLVGEIIHINDALVTLKTGESRVVVERARIARLAAQPSTGK